MFFYCEATVKFGFYFSTNLVLTPQVRLHLCFYCDAERLKMDEEKYRQQHQLLGELLAAANLQCYLDVLIQRLKVHSTTQLKYVKDEDLVELGMTKPEVQRLMKLYRKQTAQPGTFSKLKKVCSLSASQLLPQSCWYLAGAGC